MKLIAFRPTKQEDEAFEKALQMLDIDRSELAREAFRQGYAPAFKAIADRKKREAAAQLRMLERAKGFEPSTLTLAT